mmetsp:Transcript_33612/g.53459  ORF Transcript_33612/g.53459 Transcript_33612/m.53459 type:complete len:280 (+) Transcript_33612:1053-1892(+)
MVNSIRAFIHCCTCATLPVITTSHFVSFQIFFTRTSALVCSLNCLISPPPDPMIRPVALTSKCSVKVPNPSGGIAVIEGGAPGGFGGGAGMAGAAAWPSAPGVLSIKLGTLSSSIVLANSTWSCVPEMNTSIFPLFLPPFPFSTCFTLMSAPVSALTFFMFSPPFPSRAPKQPISISSLISSIASSSCSSSPSDGSGSSSARPITCSFAVFTAAGVPAILTSTDLVVFLIVTSAPLSCLTLLMAPPARPMILVKQAGVKCKTTLPSSSSSSASIWSSSP